MPTFRIFHAFRAVIAFAFLAILLTGCGAVRGVAGYGVKGVKKLGGDGPPASTRQPFP